MTEIGRQPPGATLIPFRPRPKRDRLVLLSAREAAGIGVHGIDFVLADGSSLTLDWWSDLDEARRVASRMAREHHLAVEEGS